MSAKVKVASLQRTSMVHVFRGVVIVIGIQKSLSEILSSAQDLCVCVCICSEALRFIEKN